MLFGRRRSWVVSGISNDRVCVEVHLPVVRIVAIGTHRQNGTSKNERENLYVGRRISRHIRDLGQVGFESGGGNVNIDGMVQLCPQIDTPIQIGTEVLADVTEDFFRYPPCCGCCRGC